MPSIIDAWLRSSERMTQSSSRLPSARRLASLAMKPEVKTSAASWAWRSASSCSSSPTSRCEPAMLRVPPEPTPCSASAACSGADDLGVLAHAEVVVRAPVDDDAALPSASRTSGAPGAGRSRSMKCR